MPPAALHSRALKNRFHLLVTRVRPGLAALTGSGDDGIRTHDPLLAGQVLSQLSYTPVLSRKRCLLRASQLQRLTQN